MVGYRLDKSYLCLEDHETTPIGALAAIRRVSHCASIRTFVVVVEPEIEKTDAPHARTFSRPRQAVRLSEAEDSNSGLKEISGSKKFQARI